MTTRRTPVWGLVLTLLLLPLSLRATTVIAPEFDSLVSQSDYVVRAVVKSVNSAWKENGGQKYITSKVELEVREIIKGTPPQPLVLEMAGGRVGTDELRIEGAPRFQVGDEDILFVQGNGRQIYPLVAIMHGLYPIFKDAKTGNEYVLRSNGMPLYSEQDVSLPMTSLSTVKVQNPKAQPMTAADFVRKIRAVEPLTTQEIAK
jgi:hypothetical protein